MHFLSRNIKNNSKCLNKNLFIIKLFKIYINILIFIINENYIYIRE